MTTYSKEWHYEYCMGEVECKHGDPECPHNHFLKNEPCKCPTQPNTTTIKDIDTQIEEILRQIWWHGESYGTGLVTTQAGTKDENITTATQAIKTLLIQSKIDELEKLLLESEVVRTDGIVQSYGLFNATISDCIASLKATSKEDNNG